MAAQTAKPKALNSYHHIAELSAKYQYWFAGECALAHRRHELKRIARLMSYERTCVVMDEYLTLRRKQGDIYEGPLGWMLTRAWVQCCNSASGSDYYS